MAFIEQNMMLLLAYAWEGFITRGRCLLVIEYPLVPLVSKPPGYFHLHGTFALPGDRVYERFSRPIRAYDPETSAVIMFVPDVDGPADLTPENQIITVSRDGLTAKNAFELVRAADRSEGN